jgi:hypothetical protein
MTALNTRGEGAGPPFLPSEQWIEAFTQQMTEPSFHDSMWRSAECYAGKLSHVRKVDPEAYALELVQDILDDTLEGKIAWDPARVSLRKHVRDAIKSRSRHDYRRACKRRHTSLDEGGEAMLDALAASSLETEPEQAERIRFAATIAETIRAHAADDPEVVLVLDAYEQGARSRSEVLEVVALTKLQYDAAKKRLSRLIEELPNQLITGALRTR